MKPLLLLPILLFVHVPMMAVEPLEIRLWGAATGVPGRMLPPSNATENFIRTRASKDALTNIHDPSLTIHRPKTPNGTSVIVVPGGGYAFLSAAPEVAQACEWLNSLGITAILLKYRTPTRDDDMPHGKPVQDALRAISIVRDNANAWRLDSKRVGLLGFGAGANTVAHVNCDRAWQGQRPDFGIMIYNGTAEDLTEPPKLSESFTVPADAQPIFMACTRGSEHVFTTLTALHFAFTLHQIPAQLHLCKQGGHDFAARKEGVPADDLSRECGQWMDAMGWLPSVAKVDAQIAKLQAKLEEMKPVMKRMMGCGNNGEIEATLKIKAARPVLREAELANDSAKVNELKKEIAENEQFLKDCSERDGMVKSYFAEADATAQGIRNLEFERTRILQILESCRWP